MHDTGIHRWVKAVLSLSVKHACLILKEVSRVELKASIVKLSYERSEAPHIVKIITEAGTIISVLAMYLSDIG